MHTWAWRCGASAQPSAGSRAASEFPFGNYGLQIDAVERYVPPEPVTRILHIADVHLDRPFVGMGPAAARERRAGLMTTFRRSIELARDEHCDAITIGGDLWEDEHVTADTRASVASTLERFGGPVLAIAGNHDPLLPGGHWERTEWPENVHLFGESEPTSFELYDGTLVWGLSWKGEPLGAGWLGAFRATPGRRNLLLLHGSATASYLPERDDHCPFDPVDVETAGFDYCLAGHYHRWSDGGSVVYPGSPEPLGWGHTGERGVAIVELDEVAVTVSRREVASLGYLERAVNCTGARSSAEVTSSVESQLTDTDPSHLALSIRLAGEVEPECRLSLSEIAGNLEHSYADLRLIDETTVGYDFDSIVSEKTVRGHFARRLNERIEAAESDEERERALAARLAGLRALSGRRDLLDVG